MREFKRYLPERLPYNELNQRYEIHNIVGPDEYHEKYPNSDLPGVNNNAYTNVMIVWVLERALKVLSILQPDRSRELIKILGISKKEIDTWRSITKKMFVPFHAENIISQFDGYDQLKEFDWEAYKNKYGHIDRLDRILKTEGDSTDHYQVSKQADVLMLFYLLPKEELKRIFHQLGYSQFDEACIRKTIDYYEKRTSHGSTLSKVVFSSELRYVNEEISWNHFQAALASDISDTQGGTTAEGIHLGAMSGTVDMLMRQYAGISANADLKFKPHLPQDIHELKFRMQYLGNWYYIDINKERFQLTLEPGKDSSTMVYVFGEKIQLDAGSSRDFKIHELSY